MRITLFYLSILSMGFTPVFFHVLLIRELISNFFANELIISVFLAFWLIVEALGSAVLSRRLIKKANPVSFYSFSLTLIAILGPLCLFMSRIIRSILPMQFGEVPNLLFICLGAILVLFPLAVIDGCLFTAGYHMGRSFKDLGSKTVGHVYAVESLGSVLGGIFVTLLILLKLSPFSMVLVLSCVNVIIALSLDLALREGSRRAKTSSLLPSLGGLAIVLLFSLNVSWLEEKSASLRWKEHNVLAFRNSPYHQIVLTEKEQQLSLFVDGKSVISLPEPDIVSIEEFAHIPLLYQAETKRILLMGRGFGGLISEFLKYPDVVIDYLQIDREIVETILDTGSPLLERELSDRRVNVVYEDAVSHIKRTEDVYDAIFLAEGCPSTFLSGRYLTREFLAELKKVLSQDGLLAIQTIGGESYLIDELKLMLSTIHTTLKKSFRFVDFVPGDTLILLASDGIDLAGFPRSRIVSIFQERGLKTAYLSPYSLRVKYHPTKVGLFQKIFEGGDAEVNSVNRPVVVHQAITYESAIFDPGWGALLSFLGKIPTALFFVAVLFPLALILLFSGTSKRVERFIIPLTIGLTGIAGMVGSMAITIFFQALFGSLYLKMGLIFSSFMLGIFIAALVISKEFFGRYISERMVLFIEASIFSYFLILILLFYQFSMVHARPEVPFFLEISLYLLNFM